MAAPPPGMTGNGYPNAGSLSLISGYGISSSSARTSPIASDVAACPSTAAGWPTPTTSSASMALAHGGYSRRLLGPASGSAADLSTAVPTMTYVASSAMAQRPRAVG